MTFVAYSRPDRPDGAKGTKGTKATSVPSFADIIFRRGDFMSLKDNSEIIEFLIGVYNDIYAESGQIKGTTPNIKNIQNVFERKVPAGLEKTPSGLIRVIG